VRIEVARVSFHYVAALTFAVLAAEGCSSTRDNCEDFTSCPPTAPSTSSGTGGSATPCGGACPGDRPICDESRDWCVACVDDRQCAVATAARCDTDEGECRPCDASSQCEGVKGGGSVCRTTDGVCVECGLDETAACGPDETCDLVASSCSDVSEGSRTLCDACTNSAQCQAEQACVQTRYKGINNGFFCLDVGFAFSCDPPFKRSLMDRETIEGTPTNVCGFDETTTSCPAIAASTSQLQCTADGFCTPSGGGASEETLGSLCRNVQGVLGSVCTYGCETPDDCLMAGPLSTCGPQGYCGTPQL